jgi:MbtH protein
MDGTAQDMADGWSIDGDHFVVLVNDEDQYSLWPARKTTPEGWALVGPNGSRQTCLDFIESTWTDMRPRGLRQAMDATGDGEDI